MSWFSWSPLMGSDGYGVIVDLDGLPFFRWHFRIIHVQKFGYGKCKKSISNKQTKIVIEK